MATEFTKFPKLPLELKRQIWRACATEGRVMELDSLDPYCIENGTDCVAKSTSNANAQQPAYSLVCREARDAAFKDGGYFWNIHKLWKAKGIAAEPNWHDPSLLKNPWFNPGKDTLHLNWDENHVELWSMDVNDGPLQMLIAYAQIARGGSFMTSLVQPFKKDYTCYTSQPHIDDIRDNFSFLEHMNGFKVCLTVIIIHATAKEVVDAQLFGSLAAPVQLVETSDRKTIRRMYELWLTSFFDDAKLKDPEPEKQFEEMILTPNDFEARVCRWYEEYERVWLWYKWTNKFYEGTLNSIESPRDVWTGPDFDPLGRPVTGLSPGNIYMPGHDFNRLHPWVQSILNDMPRFRPVIMFRFCEEKCHTRVPQIVSAEYFDQFLGKRDGRAH
ncbi:hypothetical protein BOTCAL_0280g00130 [Botryotinia calthae]|uniref:2EXR domain-containing protein n=1 Tax=Botryotinia calthae TaxID=38488 RepID=A0A4Y8CVW0_9HELO|nr:hypothetical protein BOTCAL_0280g00130 [Botryotinia calthae]